METDMTDFCSLTCCLSWGKSISVFSPDAGKYGPEKTPYLDNFQAVSFKPIKQQTEPLTIKKFCEIPTCAGDYIKIATL